MFERFTEEAARALFFARAKTADRDGDAITSEDLLDGILMVAPEVVARFAPASASALTPPETIEEFMQRPDEAAWRMRAGKEIRFSEGARLALERATQEADDLRHHDVRPEHLLLGILRDERTEAWRTLNESGVTLREMRRILGEGGDG